MCTATTSCAPAGRRAATDRSTVCGGCVSGLGFWVKLRVRVRVRVRVLNPGKRGAMVRDTRRFDAKGASLLRRLWMVLSFQASDVPCLLQPKMKEFLTANGRGWGVAAAEVIKKGAYIVEYAGAHLRLACRSAFRPC